MRTKTIHDILPKIKRGTLGLIAITLITLSSLAGPSVAAPVGSRPKGDQGLINKHKCYYKGTWHTVPGGLSCALYIGTTFMITS